MGTCPSRAGKETSKKFRKMERENETLREENQDKKNENEALREENQENLEKINELEDEKQKNNTNLWTTILQILQDTRDKIRRAHAVLKITAAADGFLVDLEHVGRIFVHGVVPEHFQDVVLEIVNGVLSVIRGVIDSITGFFQYLIEWVQGKLAIKNE